MQQDTSICTSSNEINHVNYVIDSNLQNTNLDYDYLQISNFNKLKTEVINANANINNYKIIIIHNSKQLFGLNKLIKNAINYVGENLKIYLYGLNGFELIIGPIKINSFDKINCICNYIVNFITRDNFDIICDEDTMNNNVNNYFVTNTNEKIIYYN